jgi:Tol biopolymer transport system component
MVSLSPDGTKVATSLLDAQTRKRDIWVFELARRIATRVTVDGIAAQWPVWSSDSKLVYWGVERGAGIYAKSPSGLGGSEQVEQVAHGATGAVAPNSISPDGKFLVYSMSANSARQRLWIHAFGSEKPNTQDTPLLRTNFQEGDAQFSSDGHWLAYTSEETGKEEIYVVPFPSLSSKLQISTAGGSQPRWQREGKEIYYIAPDGKMMAVAVEASGDSFKADSPKALFQTRSVAVTHTDHQYDVTADGQRFLINSSEQSSQPITLYANWATALKAK